MPSYRVHLHDASHRTGLDMIVQAGSALDACDQVEQHLQGCGDGYLLLAVDAWASAGDGSSGEMASPADAERETSVQLDASRFDELLDQARLAREVSQRIRMLDARPAAGTMKPHVQGVGRRRLQHLL